MARGQIRILLVEPTETGAGSIIDALRQQGCAPIHRRVENKAGLLDALKHQTWDAVIANYLLPGFSGLDALIFVRHISASLPFIMISGIYGEATAVEAMKAGASDYLLRADLGRLGTVLENELAAAESRRHRQRAEGAMQFLASIVDSSEDAIYGKDLNCIISSWNPAAERIYGYRTEDIIGKSITLLFPKHRRDELLQILTAVRGGRAITFADTERRHQDGRLIPISVIISPIRNGEGRVVGAAAIARDITRQKHIDRERERLIQSLTVKAGEVRKLTGLLPICAACKNIRNDHGYWQKVESYIGEHSDAVFSHGLCPDCIKKYESGIISPN